MNILCVISIILSASAIILATISLGTRDGDPGPQGAQGAQGPKGDKGDPGVSVEELQKAIEEYTFEIKDAISRHEEYCENTFSKKRGRKSQKEEKE